MAGANSHDGCDVDVETLRLCAMRNSRAGASFPAGQIVVVETVVLINTHDHAYAGTTSLGLRSELEERCIVQLQVFARQTCEAASEVPKRLL